MAINKLKKINLLELGAKQPRYRVTVKDLVSHKILYQVESYAGVVSTMETQPEFSLEMSQMGVPDLVTVARLQKLAWGHPMLALTCLDQLKEAIKPHLDEIREFVTRTMTENSDAPTSSTESNASEKRA